MENIDNKEVKSKKDLMMERMKGKYPDKNFEDEEVFYGQINDDFDALDGEMTALKEREKAFADLFTNDPRSATFFMSWKNGGDPLIELVRQYGTDGLRDMIDDPSKLDEVAEAQKEYLGRVAKSAALEEEYKKNLAKSMEDIATVEGDDAEIDEAVTWLMKVGRDATMGIVNPADVALAVKAITYDKGVEEAAHIGEVKGRNANIEEKLKTRAKGDGTARLDGKNKPEERQMPNFGALSNIGESIWERGDEKRGR